MKYKFRLLISVIFFLVFALCCFVFRSMPVAKIWNNYSVLYTDNSVPEATVLFYLEQEGCRDVISLSGQKMPPLSQFTMPEAIDETYLDERLGYFSDESSSYQLFYIPDQYHDRAKAAAVSLIKGTGAEAGLDGHEQYPWLVPLICFVTYLLLTLCSKKKAVFMFTGIFPLLVSLSQPFYVVAAAVCLSLVATCRSLDKKKILYRNLQEHLHRHTDCCVHGHSFCLVAYGGAAWCGSLFHRNNVFCIP